MKLHPAQSSDKTKEIIMNKAVSVLSLGLFCIAVLGCSVKKTQEGQMPGVSVQATGGQLPRYDVKTPAVQVGSKTETINVPTVHVTPADKRH